MESKIIMVLERHSRQGKTIFFYKETVWPKYFVYPGLLNSSNQLLSFQEFINKYDCNTNFLQFHQVTSVIPKYLVIRARNTEPPENELYTSNSGTRELTLKCKFKCYINPWITHWALALVKGNREPHEAKKKSFDLGGNRSQIFSLPRVVPCFPLLGLTPSGLFMGLCST